MAASGGIGRIPEGEEGLGSPLPHHCFVLGRAVTSQDFINILIVYSWPHSGPNELIILLLKEAIVAWSPWGQQWPGSAHHFLPSPPGRLSPLLERLSLSCSSFCASLFPFGLFSLFL